MFVFSSCGRGLKDESVSKLCVGGMGNWAGRKDEDVLLEGSDRGNGGNRADTVSVDVVVVVVVVSACCCCYFPLFLVPVVYCLWYFLSISACVK
jgi:hypothetical protein